ncbi:MAG: glycosyltransferase [Deltaproteobacteria bacterium]|jgi:GT2 family glycosyltransferase|nr:glycosyltransferase [Deltaproteobacteria bacterium]
MPVALNITMPVFNRLETTQRALLALRRTSREIPFSLTVVDNGSDADLVGKLREFKRIGLIDKLFLLPENMGISCACNIGWHMTEAPFYMKLDNDMIAQRADWPRRLFALWAHGKPLSTFGGTESLETLLKEPGALETLDGTLGICTATLAGGAIFIPKQVSDLLGYWSEDYDLYGAEDGDYGLRMRAAGLPQYYYLRPDFFFHAGDEDIREVYTERKLDRSRMYATLFSDDKGGTGLFRLNNYLFYMCIRNWKVPLRYAVADVSEDCRVRVVERPEYLPVAEALRRSKEMIDAALARKQPEDIYSEDFVAKLKEIWNGIGQGCDSLTDAVRNCSI